MTYGIVLTLCATFCAYYLGTLHTPSPPSIPTQHTKKANEEDEEEGESNTHSIETQQKQGETYKMVLIVRTDLGMTKGKIAAQVNTILQIAL